MLGIGGQQNALTLNAGFCGQPVVNGGPFVPIIDETVRMGINYSK